MNRTGSSVAGGMRALAQTARFAAGDARLADRLSEKDGAAEGTRTPDPIITNDVLYQLSYSGILPGRGLVLPVARLIASSLRGV